MSEIVQILKILQIHKTSIETWKASGQSLVETNFYALVEANHGFNYQLWHAEDCARREDKGYEYVYLAKREIDQCNQARNNKMEAMDEWLYKKLEPEAHTKCPVNSESPGMIIDRLSILALKKYHMYLQTLRADADETHRFQCRDKLAIIEQQLQQLASCLEQLIDDITLKRRTFRVYHQFKMYNDPTLNPELYSPTN